MSYFSFDYRHLSFILLSSSFLVFFSPSQLRFQNRLLSAANSSKSLFETSKPIGKNLEIFKRCCEYFCSKNLELYVKNEYSM